MATGRSNSTVGAGEGGICGTRGESLSGRWEVWQRLYTLRGGEGGDSVETLNMTAGKSQTIGICVWLDEDTRGEDENLK